MDIAELAEITGIERRRLRYVLDHELVPRLHLTFVEDAAGRPRQFYPDVGFAIVCAAKLLDFGLAHQKIHNFLAGLLELPFRNNPHPDPSSPREEDSSVRTLLQQQHLSATAYLADDGWIKASFEFDGHLHETRWYSFETKEYRPKNFKPFTVLSLDVSRIRDLVFGRKLANRT